MKSFFDTLRQILGRQGLWLVVAILAVLIPFVATTFELAKEFGRYPVGTIAFAAITLILLGTMAAALRTKRTEPPAPTGRIPTYTPSGQTQPAKAQPSQRGKPKR